MWAGAGCGPALRRAGWRVRGRANGLATLGRRARMIAGPLARWREKKALEPSLRKISFLGILLGRLFASVTSANVAQLVEQRTRNA